MELKLMCLIVTGNWKFNVFCKSFKILYGFT